MTSNAFLTEKNAKSDFVLSPTYGVAVSGDITSALSYRSEVRVNNERFRLYSELDSETVGIKSNVTYAVDDWQFIAEYYPKWNYSRGFEDLLLAVHDFTGTVRRPYQFSDTTIVPSVAVRRRLADIGSAENVKLAASVKFVRDLMNDTKLILAPGAAYTMYDEQVAGRDRRDLFLSFDAALVWSPNAAVDVSLSVSAGRNESPIDGLSYSVFAVSPTLGLTAKF